LLLLLLLLLLFSFFLGRGEIEQTKPSKKKLQ